jgi:hypothetical protein
MLLQFWLNEEIGGKRWIGHSGGFDDDVVESLFVRYQHLHNSNEIASI